MDVDSLTTEWPKESILKTKVDVGEAAARYFCGNHDDHLRRLEGAFSVTVAARGSSFTVAGEGDGVTPTVALLVQFDELLESDHKLSHSDLATAIRVLQESPDSSLAEFFSGKGLVAAARRLVAPRSLNQKRYLEAMLDHDLVVSVGPAGTGKTYLAVAMAAAFLVQKRVRRIVLARPAVEAGEKLGFLPGDLADKVNPYLRPLYDALYDLMGFDKVTRMMEREVIEVAPLAFMRGRTLNDSFIILDEAQNTTPEQMKMFLTRIGFGSMAVVNGDITQVDLAAGQPSGLRIAQTVLKGVEGVAFVNFSESDVVRHDLVQRIVKAYSAYESSEQSRSAFDREVAARTIALRSVEPAGVRDPVSSELPSELTSGGSREVLAAGSTETSRIAGDRTRDSESGLA